MKPTSKLLLILTIILILVNIAVIYYLDELAMNIMRVVNMASLFVFLLWQNKYSRLQLCIFILFLVCDTLLLDYHNPVFNFLIYVTRMSAYFLLFVMILPKMRMIKIDLIQVSFIIGLIAIGMLSLSALYDMIPKMSQFNSFELLFYFYGIAGLFAIISAIYFNNRFENKASFYFVVAILSLLFSDLTFFIATYLGFPEFFLPDRVLNIIGIAALVHFVKLDKKKDKTSGYLEL